MMQSFLLFPGLRLLGLLSVSLLLHGPLLAEAVRAEAPTEAEAPPELREAPTEAAPPAEEYAAGPRWPLTWDEGSRKQEPEHAEMTLLEIMRRVRAERRSFRRVQKAHPKGLPARIDTDLLMGLIVTGLVVLYAIRIRTRRYSHDELTLKMSRQTRWFKPAKAAYRANDGHTYVVTLNFKGVESMPLPKRYTQEEKEKLTALFENALTYFSNIPRDETSCYLIENWSPSENIVPIDIKVIRLPYKR